MKILLVEDNDRLADRLSEKLGKKYVVDRAATGSEARVLVHTVDYSLILLDLGLPDESGIDVCTDIRRSKDTPIIILTGEFATDTKVDLLASGVDDFIVKPFDFKELTARIDAVSRRQSRPQLKKTLTHKDLVVDTERQEVTRDGVSIRLRKKEFQILEHLLLHKGRILTREMILSLAWGHDTTSWKGTVDVHIKHLRDKIDRPFEEAYIKTVYGLGYRIE
jgi:DNA-binding response OmpR family regulator